ncbi:hypothetical protein HX017_04900 [Myroides marinus]|uniref:Uncharacterized protein n=1 Tax=Myroides marinus TaxID=703342 RepID=A0A1H6SW27_9FLAO|nr:hypothetical protein [Myroides marinus]KUF43193.1 hypothetical protein AS361_09690 [Myroides marinus]MDM1350057.1 hypothetical protein [Myroides marinus]MDM1357324.1 hypothetical protein [Myroides marinus]MDM1364291.1 hypothetical protein [Myroides marinus]MDM1374240.1 hypothetical protein [Myroides marinus]
MFKIKGKEFDVQYAYLDAYVNTSLKQLVFGLQIGAKDINDLIGRSKLFFNSEILLGVNANELNIWEDIAGKTIEWQEYSEDEGKPRALFYVFEHTEVTNTKVEFKAKKEKLIVKISATIDIYGNNGFDENLPLEIETEVDFFGVLCGRSTFEECQENLTPYINLDSLKYVKNNNGVSLMVPVDTDLERNILFLGDY